MRLLLCEDESESAEAIAFILRHNNYTVDICADGIEAMDYLAVQAYDVVILDIMMPKMDGMEVLRQIRLSGTPQGKYSILSGHHVPVILLTAKSQTTDIVEGLDAGADDYLKKPFETQELLARIRAVTRRQEPGKSPDNVLRVGNICLNRSSFELSSSEVEKTFRLANREFQILELLINRPGAYISAEDFMDQIWGFDSEAEVNVVWVYISNLRKKLKKLKANVEITMARNIGYTLEIHE